MAWVRLDDHFDEHPKIQAVGPLGLALFVAGLAYCNRNLTDGFIPWTAARALLSWEFIDPTAHDGERRVYQVAVSCGMTGQDASCPFVIDLLLRIGLWEEVEGGYRVHDYLEYQPSKDQVLTERDKARERMVRVRSGEVRANTERTSGEVPAKFACPVPDPVPAPKVKEKVIQITQPAAATEKSPANVGVAVKPYDAFVALCEETGMEPTAVPKTAKNTALRYCKEMLDAKYSVDQIVRCYRYLSKEHWRGSPVDAYAITKAIASWHARGELTDPPAEGRKGQAANNGQGEQERDHGQYAKYVKTFGSQD